MKKRWYAIIACGLFVLVSMSSAAMLRSSSGGHEELITVWDLVMVSLGGPIAQDDVSFMNGQNGLFSTYCSLY